MKYFYLIVTSVLITGCALMDQLQHPEKYKNTDSGYSQHTKPTRQVATETPQEQYERNQRTLMMLQMMNGVYNQPQQQQPVQQKQRCRTVYYPGNGLDGSAGNSRTECD